MIKCTEKPLVGRREHDQATARTKQSGGRSRFTGVVFNVLQHVHVQHTVENRLFREAAHRADYDEWRRCSPLFGGHCLEPSRLVLIRLEAYPAARATIVQGDCSSSDSRADFQHVASQILSDL